MNEERRTESESLLLLHQKVDFLVESHKGLKAEVYDKGGIKDSVKEYGWEIEQLKTHRKRLYAISLAAGLTALGSILTRFFNAVFGGQ